MLRRYFRAPKACWPNWRPHMFNGTAITLVSWWNFIKKHFVDNILDIWYTLPEETCFPYYIILYCKLPTHQMIVKSTRYIIFHFNNTSLIYFSFISLSFVRGIENNTSGNRPSTHWVSGPIYCFVCSYVAESHKIVFQR